MRDTGIRVPLKHGFPPQISGSLVIYFNFA
jgi:hypothetical protein